MFILCVLQTETAETKEVKLIEQTDVALNAPNENPSSSEKTDATKKSVTEEDEYKQKLAEKRRLAREKAEREAEEERQRLERERLALIYVSFLFDRLSFLC